MKSKTIYRFIIAGGGTGGHLYPALAVAQKIRELKPESEILFVGTKNKIEARVVPNYGFDFKPIWISGFSRKLTVNNMLFPIKLLVSIFQSLAINMKLKPRVAIGCGAYVSGPVVWSASVMGANIMLLEQNSYPGITNRLLEKKADEIHLAFEESKKYFRNTGKLFVSGNPVRINMKLQNKSESIKSFGLDGSKKTLLVIGGSLGARSINQAIAGTLGELTKNGIQIIWQAGPGYIDEYKKFNSESVKVSAFIDNMSSAYSACDLVMARAGATTIAEVSYLGLPVVFVPSTNVAANHQYMNAKAMVDGNAAIMIEDKNLNNELVPKVLELINDENRMNELKERIMSFAKPEAAVTIAERALKLAEQV